MPHEPTSESRELVIQLARLGDVVQSLPAVEALREAHPERILDILCPAPSAAVLARSGAIHRVIPWDGGEWRNWAGHWSENPVGTLHRVQAYLASLGELAYEHIYPLNQHARSLLITQLFSNPSAQAKQGRGVEEGVHPWKRYLRQVAEDRGNNRVHLADAWCGMCGVRPRGQAPVYEPTAVDLPQDLAPIGGKEGRWVALVVGAGESDRRVPPTTWGVWIREFLSQLPDGQVVLIGSGQERETGQAILETLPALLQGRVWDATGRTNLNQLMYVLQQCRWVVGADTGPLHMGTLVGSRALGFYFSRARVHETGPYGEGHWVYQSATQHQPDSWPIMESIALICDDQRHSAPGWTLWRSHMDEWGAFFDDGDGNEAAVRERATIWRTCAPTLCESVAA